MRCRARQLNIWTPSSPSVPCPGIQVIGEDLPGDPDSKDTDAIIKQLANASASAGSRSVLLLMRGGAAARAVTEVGA